MIDSFFGTDTSYAGFVELGIKSLIRQEEYRFIPIFCIVTFLSCLFPSMVKWQERVNYSELYPFVVSKGFVKMYYSTLVDLTPEVYAFLQQLLQDRPDLDLNTAIEKGLLMLIRHEELNKTARGSK